MVPLRIGFLPLSDTAPLFVAAQRGHFARQGLRVELCRQVGWATLRDKLILGELDAASALAPMLWAMRLGLGCAPTSVVTGFILSNHGTALTVSNSMGEAGWDGSALRAAVKERRSHRPITFGVVHLYSSHYLLLSNWIKKAGLEAGKDVRIVVVPPAQMHRTLAAGTIDGYAAGEPWNSLAVAEGSGVCPFWGATVPPCPVEKVFAVTESFAENQGSEHAALIRALGEASQWCDNPDNRPELSEILSHRDYVNLPAKYLRPSLVGPFDTGRAMIKVPGLPCLPSA